MIPDDQSVRMPYFSSNPLKNPIASEVGKSMSVVFSTEVLPTQPISLPTSEKEFKATNLPSSTQSREDETKRAEALYKQIGREFDRVVLYGYVLCGYDSFAKKAIKKAGIEVCDFTDAAPEGPFLPTEKKDNEQGMKHELVRLVIDNVIKQHKIPPASITPCLFCIDTNFRAMDPIDISQSQPYKSKGYFTTKELRRAYKLCFDPSLPEEIKQMAQKTFIFVKVNKGSEENKTETSFEVIPPPWNDPSTKKKLDERIRQRKKNTMWRDHCWVQLAKLTSDKTLINETIIEACNIFIRKSLFCECIEEAKNESECLKDEKIMRYLEKGLASLYDSEGTLAIEIKNDVARGLALDADRFDLAMQILKTITDPELRQSAERRTFIKAINGNANRLHRCSCDRTKYLQSVYVPLAKQIKQVSPEILDLAIDIELLCKRGAFQEAREKVNTIENGELRQALMAECDWIQKR